MSPETEIMQTSNYEHDMNRCIYLVFTFYIIILQQQVIDIYKKYLKCIHFII